MGPPSNLLQPSSMFCYSVVRFGLLFCWGLGDYQVKFLSTVHLVDQQFSFCPYRVSPSGRIAHYSQLGLIATSFAKADPIYEVSFTQVVCG